MAKIQYCVTFEDRLKKHVILQSIILLYHYMLSHFILVSYLKHNLSFAQKHDGPCSHANSVGISTGMNKTFLQQQLQQNHSLCLPQRVITKVSLGCHCSTA